MRRRMCVSTCITLHCRDMQLLTMEEATVYEKKEKARKTLGVLQSQVHTIMYTHVEYMCGCVCSSHAHSHYPHS